MIILFIWFSNDGYFYENCFNYNYHHFNYYVNYYENYLLHVQLIKILNKSLILFLFFTNLSKYQT